MPLKFITWLAPCAFLLWPCHLAGQTWPVRRPEGLLHAFLVLKTTDGTSLADGELIQTSRGDLVSSRLVFHFKDGSIHDESSEFSQRRGFRLLTNRLIQKGPAFPQPLEMSIDASGGRATVRYVEAGKPKVETAQIDVHPDLANGLIVTLLKNADAGALPKSVTYVTATPKPRLVKLTIIAAGHESFSTAGAVRNATHYVLKVEIGGISGLLAPLVGRQPPNSHVWILEGEAPSFIKSEQPLYAGGPLWRIETVSPGSLRAGAAGQK